MSLYRFYKIIPYSEEVISPVRGSTAFWYSLEPKGHRLPESVHGGCPILKGSKWIINKWVYYFDQWKKFPCHLKAEHKWFEPPNGYY
jgi:prolyl 4-hydroxylase